MPSEGLELVILLNRQYYTLGHHKSLSIMTATLDFFMIFIRDSKELLSHIVSANSEGLG
jgi:hypothetical protein